MHAIIDLPPTHNCWASVGAEKGVGLIMHAKRLRLWYVGYIAPRHA